MDRNNSSWCNGNGALHYLDLLNRLFMSKEVLWILQMFLAGPLSPCFFILCGHLQLFPQLLVYLAIHIQSFPAEVLLTPADSPIGQYLTIGGDRTLLHPGNISFVWPTTCPQGNTPLVYACHIGSESSSPNSSTWDVTTSVNSLPSLLSSCPGVGNQFIMPPKV